MKKFCVLLIALFIVNGAIAQRSIPALPINASTQRIHPTINLPPPTPISLENVQNMMGSGNRKTFDNYTGINSRQTINPHTLQQHSLIKIYDSIYYWQMDSLSPGWIFRERLIDIIYDDNNNLRSELSQKWNGSTWENVIKTAYDYDTNNNLISQKFKVWTSNGWEDLTRYIYTYDANNNLTSELFLISNGYDWVNFSLTTYTYDVNNNLLSMLYQDWNGIDWVNFSLKTYTYDANNNLISGLYQLWKINNYENYSLFIYTYDANNNLTGELWQFSNGIIWENNDQFIYTYDANNNLTSKLSQWWYGGVWENDILETYTYNINNNLIIYQEQMWGIASWWDDLRGTYTYDANDNETGYLEKWWDGSTWVNDWQTADYYEINNFNVSHTFKEFNSVGAYIIYGDSVYYYFQTVLGINDLMMPEEGICVYPNPSNGKFRITCSNTIGFIEIYNKLGALIYSDSKFNRQTSAEIDLSGQAKGLYFIKIYNETKINSRKIVVH